MKTLVLAEGQAPYVDFTSVISVDCHDHSEVGAAVMKRPLPQPLSDPSRGRKVLGGPASADSVPLSPSVGVKHLGMVGCSYHLSPLPRSIPVYVPLQYRRPLV